MKQRVKRAADGVAECIEMYLCSGKDPHYAMELGLALACKGQPTSFKDEVRAELRTRGYRI